MAKRRLTGATFVAAAGTIEHADFSDITLAGIQLITNVTSQVIIYNFADTTKGGTLSVDTLTLEYDTAAMANGDSLMILVDDALTQTVNIGTVATLATAAKQDTLLTELQLKADLTETQPVSIASMPSTPVTGTFWQATQPVNGTVTANAGTGTLAVSGPLTDAQLRATAVPVSISSDIQIGAVEIKNGTDDTRAVVTASNALKVDGSAVTQPVSGTFFQATQPISLSTLPVTNAGTFAVQVDGSALTALQLLDDTVATLGTTTYTEATTKGNVIGVVRRDADTTLVDTTNEIGPLQMDANGRLKVEVFSGETLPISGTVTANAGTGTLAVSIATAPVLVTGSAIIGRVGIDQATANANEVVLKAGSASVGTVVLTAETTKVIGTVNQGTSPWVTSNATTSVVGNGAAATAQRVSLANDSTGIIATVSTVTNLSQQGGVAISLNTGVRDTGTQRITIATNDIVQVVGEIAHDAVDSGNPQKIGGRASSAPVTAVAVNDRVDAFFDLQGRLIVSNKAATGTQTTVAGSATNVTLLAANTARQGATIYNDSTVILYVRLQATATTSNFSTKLFAEDYLEVPFGYTGIIDGIWASATGNARVTEIT